MEKDKEYLNPDYSSNIIGEEELPFDSGPSEDDDDDEYYEDFDEDDQNESEIEDYLDKQDKLNNDFMQTSGAFNNNGGNNNSNSPWGSNNSNNGNRQEVNRKKKVIFCDILDCLVETYQSNGRPGLLPRGIYDIKLRFEVWDKLSMFSPERIYAMVPRFLLNSSNGSESWRVMLEYVICSLSEYLRLPYKNCQVLTQTSIGQSKEEVMLSILDGGEYKIPRDEVVQIGIESGLSGQNNRDQLAAEICGIDYIDLNQLMTIYW